MISWISIWIILLAIANVAIIKSRGQLGQGNMDNLGDEPNEMGDNLSFIDLGVGRTAKAIAAGGLHTCVILNDDQVKCFGSNE